MFGKLTRQEVLNQIPKYCILSGSRGFGEPHENSDYDFYVPESKWREFKEWFYQFTTENSLPSDSCITGQLCFYIGTDGSDLFEFSYLFPRNRSEYNLIRYNR